MPSTSNKRAAPVTSPHFSPLSATPEKPSKKRKIADGSGTATGGTISDLKFYAVRAGKKPGVYDNWVDCQKQILNFKGEAKCKLIALQFPLSLSVGVGKRADFCALRRH